MTQPAWFQCREPGKAGVQCRLPQDAAQGAHAKAQFMKACPHCQASYPTNYTHCPRDGTPLMESQAWREGTTIRGKYRILGKIGEGGMAVVYKAMHTRFEELRALKVMNAELSGDQAFVRRFMHEAVLTRKLQHGNAVRVEDIDEAEDGRPFIVMEYIEGRSLKEAIQSEAPMAAGRVCSIAAQVAGALDAAHRLGIIHRDIKPANIFLVNAAGRETAKVLDFGIAKAKEGSSEDGMLSHSTLTGAGSVIGTPAYMSPEQARGLRGDQLDGRSDLYSLGVVMYEMLINGLPLKADTSVQWILAHAHTPPKPLWEARPDLQIPPAVAALVMRCLAKNPLDRPESAYNLIEEIRQAEQQGWSPGRTLVFSSPAQQSWASGVAPAPASDVPQTFATAAEAARAGAQLLSAPVQSPSSRRWAAWGTAAGLGVIIAGAILFWSLKRPTPTPAATIGEAAVSQSATSNVPSATEAPAPTTIPATPQLPAIPASQITHSADTTDSTNTAAPPLVEATRDNTDSAPAGDTSESARQKKLRARSQAEVLAKSRQFAQALLQAKNAENDGRFEDALREYEWASTLEPSDTALKRHIKQLRDRIARENELIH